MSTIRGNTRSYCFRLNLSNPDHLKLHRIMLDFGNGETYKPRFKNRSQYVVGCMLFYEKHHEEIEMAEQQKL